MCGRSCSCVGRKLLGHCGQSKDLMVAQLRMSADWKSDESSRPDAAVRLSAVLEASLTCTSDIQTIIKTGASYVRAVIPPILCRGGKVSQSSHRSSRLIGIFRPIDFGSVKHVYTSCAALQYYGTYSESDNRPYAAHRLQRRCYIPSRPLFQVCDVININSGSHVLSDSAKTDGSGKLLSTEVGTGGCADYPDSIFTVAHTDKCETAERLNPHRYKP